MSQWDLRVLKLQSRTDPGLALGYSRPRNVKLSLLTGIRLLSGAVRTLQDAEGSFRLRVSQDMNMSVGGARYYLRLAAELDPKKEPLTCFY
jgi:hypothetical protein